MLYTHYYIYPANNKTYRNKSLKLNLSCRHCAEVDDWTSSNFFKIKQYILFLKKITTFRLGGDVGLRTGLLNQDLLSYFIFEFPMMNIDMVAKHAAAL